MSKLYLLILMSIFIGVSLSLNSMSTAENFKDEEVENIMPTRRPINLGSLLRIERPANFKEKRMGTNPQQLVIIDDKGKNTGIYIDIPEAHLNLNIPSDAHVLPVSRPGLEGAKIELADGKFVNVLFPNLNTLPNESTLTKEIPWAEGTPQAAAMQTQAALEKMQNNMEKLQKLNSLFQRYKNDIKSIKADPEFNNIKPALKDMYLMILSIPFFLPIASNELKMLETKILDNVAKEAAIPGFEDLNLDTLRLTDNIFAFVDKFVEFLKNFSQHFTENKIIQELIAD